MKRLTLAVLAALALIAGLVAGPAANAGDPYPGTVRTSTSISAPNSVKAGKKVAIKVKVATPGSGQPSGKVSVSLAGPGGFSVSATKNYDGGKVTFTTSKLKKPGKYKVTAKFDAARGSVFKDSKDTDAIAVKKKKK